MVCTKHSETAEKSCQTVTAFVLALREALYPGTVCGLVILEYMHAHVCVLDVSAVSFLCHY